MRFSKTANKPSSDDNNVAATIFQLFKIRKQYSTLKLEDPLLVKTYDTPAAVSSNTSP